MACYAPVVSPLPPPSVFFVILHAADRGAGGAGADAASVSCGGGQARAPTMARVAGAAGAAGAARGHVVASSAPATIPSSVHAAYAAPPAITGNDEQIAEDVD